MGTSVYQRSVVFVRLVKFGNFGDSLWFCWDMLVRTHLLANTVIEDQMMTLWQLTLQVRNLVVNDRLINGVAMVRRS